MNNSVRELHSLAPNDEALIETGLRLLPIIGRTLYSAISELGQVHGLTVTQVKALLHLSSGARTTVGEVASALGISMPAASELVDRLVDAGHVVRSPDPVDRRRVLIAATPRSAQIGEQLRDFRRQQLRIALLHLPPGERPMFIRSLEALVSGLQETSQLELLHASAAHESALASADSGKD